MLTWLKKIWRGSSRGALQKSVPSNIEVQPDGFVPASQFDSTSMQFLYESTSWAYACIVANAIMASSLGSQVQRREGARWVNTSHPLNDFLASPSGPVPAGQMPSPPHWSWSQLVFIGSANLLLDGNSYLVPRLSRTANRLLAVHPLMADSTHVQENPATKYPERYYNGGTEYDPSEIVHTVFTSPLSFSSGHAPVRAALRAMDIEYAAGERAKYNMDNKVAPGLVFAMKGFMGVTDEQRRQFQQYLQDSYSRATNDGRPLVVGDGTDVVSAPNQHNVAYRDLRTLARDEMLATFRTPPPVVGVYDNATLQNFAQAFKIWWMLGLYPMIRMWYESINQQLIWPIYGDDVRLWYDDRNSDIAILLMKDQIANAQGLVNIGYPPNKAAIAAGLDLEYVPELDVPLQNLAMAGRDTQ